MFQDNISNVNEELNLGFDDVDIEYYKNYFKSIDRMPKDVELFDLAQSDSEHSRHWIFNGQLVIDGNYIDETLFKLVKEPLKRARNNSTAKHFVIISAIKGFCNDNSRANFSKINHLIIV